MRSLLPLILALLGSASLLIAQQRPVVTVNVRGDRVEFDQEAGTIAVHGDVSITAQSDRPGMPTVAIASGEVEADLTHGLIIAHDDVRLLSQQLAMRGRRVEVRFAQDEFVLHYGQVSVAAVSPDYPNRPVRGYFFGHEIRKTADVIYVVEGRVTTCDRAHPHYSIGVRQLTYDTRTTRWTIRDGRLILYGHTLRLPGSYSALLRSRTLAKRQSLQTPGYSSYDGLFVPVSWDLSPAGGRWDVSAIVRLGTQFKLPAEIAAVRETEREVFSLRAAHREQVTWDVNARARVNYLPEVAYTRRLLLPRSGDRASSLELSAAYIKEEPPAEPSSDALKARLALDYTPQARARRLREGGWWAVAGEQSLYDTGEHLRDLQLELGLGSDQSRLTRGALWYVHHEASGNTPFLFDDVYAEDELYGQFTMALGAGWSLDSYARLDLDETRLREWELGLYRRLHCLTWGLRWNRAAESLSVEVSINGLTGGTPPYDSHPAVDPAEVPPLPSMVPGPSPDALLTLPGSARPAPRGN